MVWCDAVFGEVWCGVVWCGVMQCLVRCGVVWNLPACSFGVLSAAALVAAPHAPVSRQCQSQYCRVGSQIPGREGRGGGGGRERRGRGKGGRGRGREKGKQGEVEGRAR